MSEGELERMLDLMNTGATETPEEEPQGTETDYEQY